jgi:nicotinate-nucleotide adenylyltransferase
VRRARGRILTLARLGRIVPRRIGLFGGSFNPAHRGHLHVARMALRALDLDQIWLLVSPQNPLKAADGMAPLTERLAGMRALAAGDRRLWASALEGDLDTRYTAETLAMLRRRFPRARFVWLMGADNLAQLSRWERWSSIFHTAGVAVFDRPSYARFALASKAARRYARHRATAHSTRRLATQRLPRWAFLHSRLDQASASSIRAARERRQQGRER